MCVDVEASVGEDAEVLVLLAMEAEGVAVAAGEECGFWILDFHLWMSNYPKLILDLTSIYVQVQINPFQRNP